MIIVFEILQLIWVVAKNIYFIIKFSISTPPFLLKTDKKIRQMSCLSMSIEYCNDLLYYGVPYICDAHSIRLLTAQVSSLSSSVCFYNYIPIN